MALYRRISLKPEKQKVKTKLFQKAQLSVKSIVFVDISLVAEPISVPSKPSSLDPSAGFLYGEAMLNSATFGF